MRVRKKQEKGITLIALVITIVVLIILATVSINMILDDKGIIGAAELAKDKYQKATQKEKQDMYGLEEYVGDNLESVGIVPTVEELQSRYEFEYYSSMTKAVNDVNAGTIGENAEVDKENAVAGIYTKEDNIYVVLLKDNVEENRVEPRVDMTINLGGNKLSSTQKCCIDMYSGNVTIDGRLEGSKIEVSGTSKATSIQIRAGSLNINGGTYIVNSVGAETYNACIYFGGGNSKIINAIVKSIDNNGNTTGISVGIDATATISNCNITALSLDGRSIGVSLVSESSIATVINCDIKAYSNYSVLDEGGYGAYSRGIVNNRGNLKINDCNVTGTHSGLENFGTLHVNGGTYESYGHGGIYFGGTGTESWVRNATIRECDMTEGYTATHDGNESGFYIGGATGNDNIQVYMDSCNIYGSSKPIVLRGTSGEQNNSLYISNSKINTDKKIRIDNDTHRLYIGVGNNFTADNTTLPSAVVTTSETYIQE